METERKDAIYAIMVKEAEARSARGKTPTRFDILLSMDAMHFALDKDLVNLADKLYADGFVTA